MWEMAFDTDFKWYYGSQIFFNVRENKFLKFKQNVVNIFHFSQKSVGPKECFFFPFLHIKSAMFFMKVIVK